MKVFKYSSIQVQSLQIGYTQGPVTRKIGTCLDAYIQAREEQSRGQY